MNSVNGRLLFRMVVLVFAATWGLNGLSAASAETKTTASVGIQKYEWNDSRRLREVPVKIYYPEAAKGPIPVIIFSHGLGGSRESYEYLGRYWASHGYICVHVQHKGADTSVWLGKQHPVAAMAEAAIDPRNAINPPLDVQFSIGQLEKMNREDSLFKGRLDLNHIGMAGHSLGARTALVLAGQLWLGPMKMEKSMADPRVKAVMAMSPPVPVKRDELDRTYGAIRVPCFFMTGTKDSTPETFAKDRRIPYDHIPAVEEYLVIFNDADHMIFTGRRLFWVDKDDNAMFKNMICESSLAFWDAYLKNDAAAKHWLADGGFEKKLAAQGTFEVKGKEKTPAENDSTMQTPNADDGKTKKKIKLFDVKF